MQTAIATVCLSGTPNEKREAIAKAGFNFDGGFFFGIVERLAYRGFGAPNPPIRLAAQTRRILSRAY
ncbi:MAG TPA: hypothetical protein VGG57_04570 [Stellaceae bacterium]|jgi:4-hydroxyphenylpyruvate dioxygenase-like putative hemolysin